MLSYSNNIWFYFTAQGTSVDITVSGVNRPQYFISSGYSGNPCDINDAVGIDCVTGSGNWSTVSGTTNNLIVGTTYYVQVVNNTGGGGGSGNVTLCIDNPPTPATPLCDNIKPFCTDGGTTFAASTSTTASSGPDYDCLITQPNPAWFYLEISTAGDISIGMSSNPAVDIDFIIWGPFTDTTDGCYSGIADPANVVTCSFSSSTTESGTITGAQVGETYVLMITNFSGSATDITATQTGGTGATDCAIVLPINMLSFDAKFNPKNLNVDLNWSTLSEQNNDYFTLERSIDGTHFEVIGIIDGSGNSTTTKDYNLIDKNSPLNSTVYYKLSQTDFDGEKTESGLLAVKTTTLDEVVLLPNPIEGDAQLKFTGFVNQDIKIKIFDLLGHLTTSVLTHVVEGENVVTLPTTKLTSGMYLLSIYDEDGREIKQTKVFKQ